MGWCVDTTITFHSVLTYHFRLYQLLIDGWGDITVYMSANWLLACDPMIAGVVAAMVQLFFAWRIHIIARQPWLTMFIAFCSLATLCGGVGTGIAVLWDKSFSLFANFKPIACVWLISGAAADVSITAALTYHLRRRRGTFEATDRLLDHIIQRKLSGSLILGRFRLIYPQSLCKMVSLRPSYPWWIFRCTWLQFVHRLIFVICSL